MTLQEFKEVEESMERIKGLYLKEIDWYIKWSKFTIYVFIGILTIVFIKGVFQ